MTAPQQSTVADGIKELERSIDRACDLITQLREEKAELLAAAKVALEEILLAFESEDDWSPAEQALRAAIAKAKATS